jgi:hypothetical protein
MSPRPHTTIPFDHKKSGSKIEDKSSNEKTERVMETLETWIA